MLRCNPVCQLDCLIEIFDDQNGTSSVEAGVGDPLSLQRRELPLQLLPHLLSECLEVVIRMASAISSCSA